MNPSTLTTSSSSTFLNPLSLPLRTSNNFNRRRRFRVSVPRNSSSDQSAPSTSSSPPPPPAGNTVFVGGERELTGIQPLVACLSPPVRLASSALLIGAAIAAGYGLGSRFGKAQGNVATVGGAAALGAAAAAAAYAVSAAVPDVAAADLHNYVAGCDDPKVVNKDDIERIAKK